MLPSNKTPVRVTGTFTPSGTQDVNVISPIPLPVTGTLVIAGDTSTTSVVTRVPSSVTNQALVAANPLRKGLCLYNHGNAYQYIKIGTTATLTDFTVVLTPRMFYEVQQPIYIGQIDVISSSTDGAIQVTELS
jgi:hypothetical protein